MADRLTIQQSLHGYSDGHRLIATSISLPPNDAKAVLTLSDSSGSGGWRDDSGYLTGYPLRESGLYALARTWRAKEMPRPGCVWTHTLFLDFSDLAKLSSLEQILPLLRRPGKDASSNEYATALMVPLLAPTQEPPLPPQELNWCRHLMVGLYEFPQDRIVVEQTEQNPEPGVLAIWLQQWPRLRRSFAFCTGTQMDRSSDRLRFDLQVVARNERGSASRFPNTRNIGTPSSIVENAPWLELALGDLLSGRKDSMRTFLMQIGAEIDGGRNVFASLIDFYRLLEEADTDPTSIDAALLISQDTFTEESSVGYRLLADKAVLHAGELSSSAHDFLLGQIPLLNRDVVSSNAVLIGEVTWDRSPQRFCQLINASENEALIATRTLDSISVTSLIVGLRTMPELTQCILDQRPDITGNPEFWRDGSIVDAGFDFLGEKSGGISDAITAMIQSGESRLAYRAVAAFGARNVWYALAPAINEATAAQVHELFPWVQGALSDHVGTAEALAAGRLATRKLLSLIAHHIGPDDIPNQFGDDPWILAVRSAKGKLSPTEQVFLSGFLMARALGPASRNCAELAVHAFDRLHEAAAASMVTNETWDILERRLPMPMFWQAWDRCYQLRMGVAELFVKRELSARMFAKLTTNDETFAQLVESTANQFRGKSYLKQVLRALIEEKETDNRIRTQIIDEFLKSSW